MNGSNWAFFAIVAGLILVALLYRRFYSDRTEDGKDELNWVNDSNYNIATSDAEEEVLEDASPAEARHIVETNKSEGPYPPSDEEFHTLEDKLDPGKYDSETVRDRLKDPEA